MRSVANPSLSYGELIIDFTSPVNYENFKTNWIYIWYLFGGSDNSGANTGAVSRKRNEYGAVIYIVYA